MREHAGSSCCVLRGGKIFSGSPGFLARKNKLSPLAFVLNNLSAAGINFSVASARRRD